jgi:hypothetical protein
MPPSGFTGDRVVVFIDRLAEVGGRKRRAGTRRRPSNQAEMEAFAAAKVSRAMRLAASAQALAGGGAATRYSGVPNVVASDPYSNSPQIPGYPTPAIQAPSSTANQVK